MTDKTTDTASAGQGVAEPASRSIEWFSEGEARTVEAEGVRVTIRFVSRRGRRARILIQAPAGASFYGDDQ